MASKPSPCSPLTLDELNETICAHRQWERSGGQEGQKANLSGANLEGLDLDGYDLSELDFQGANLARVRFGEALVEGANFGAANLKGADLSGARGLLAPQLAGADLAGARLPEDLEEFAGLKHVDAASGHVQRIFFLLLLVCVFCWLTIAITTDASLLNNFGDQALPIIGTKINLVMFYWAAPFLLLCVYLYFHLCLQRLWEALAGLPAGFPDGLPLPQRVHPWLWNGLVWAFSPRLRDHRPPLLFLQKILAILLIWWAGPLTLLALWYRYLSVHDWTITAFHLILLTLSMDGAIGFSLLTRATLGLKEKKPFLWKKLWLTVKGMALLLVTAAIAGAFSYLSLNAIGREGDLPDVRANLREAEVSLKSSQWTGKPGDIDLVRGAFLRGKDLRFAQAEMAFLAKADLESADLQQAYLEGANLQQANLKFAHLTGSRLQKADLQAAKGLLVDEVRKACCWPLAKYSQEMLKVLELPPEHNQNIDNKNLIKYQLPQANLERADLKRVNLEDANLIKAYLFLANLEQAILRRANLQQADLGGADLQQADLGGANLQQADLDGANLQGALGLERQQVQAASCWQLAKYSNDMLKSLELLPEHNKRLDNKNLNAYQMPHADLRSANFLSFNLRGANLQGANLEDAYMEEADLTNADLCGANLTDVEFNSTNLKGADLREAKGLTRDQLKSAIMDESTKLPDELKDLVPSKSQ